ncbi:hypothetical protein [Clostridium formicaceticum]|uniref:Uncharacterized protein n=1 Tax=Clostridium formicaceticum TaxID=1497 RepID=A0AAC9RRV7_9CLOT|nr:hypothetical protein [Clostridium formicaceticum]AOY75360.1 hypothetical protein BJL90_05275 [Clostridium formicaceticum]ARE89815.1 hypothetical protein CLFO_42980 [Clostridium formicaceticum]
MLLDSSIDSQRQMAMEHIYKVKGEIEDHIKEFSITKLSFKDAVHETLLRHSDLILLYMHKQLNLKEVFKNSPIKFDISDFTYETVLQESIKWGIRWIYDYCNQKQGENFVPKLIEVVEFLNYAFAYELFFLNWYATYNKLTDVIIDGEHIKFVSKNPDEKHFIGYNNWRKVCRENQILGNIKDCREDIYKAMQKAHESDFEIMNEWEINGYTWSDFKKFSSALDNYLTRLNMKEIEKAKKDGLVTISLKREDSERYIINEKKDWWTSLLLKETGLNIEIITSIIDDLTYNPDIKNTEISFQFFIPVEDKLMLSSRFVNLMVRPERNFLNLIPKLYEKKFNNLSNDCEDMQESLIKNFVTNRSIIYNKEKTKEQSVRPGMDLLIFDTHSLKLLVVELKWNIPPYDIKEVIGIDKKVKKGVERLSDAKKYVAHNLDTILQEYFGEEWKQVKPSDIEYLVAIKESIGSGNGCDLCDPVITVDHLIELLNNGMNHLFEIIREGKREYYSDEVEECWKRVEILNYKIDLLSYEIKRTSNPYKI